MTITELTWDSLATVAAMGLFVAAIMLLLLKPLISLLFALVWAKLMGEDVPYSERADQLLGLLTNVVTLGTAFGLSYWRLAGVAELGAIFLHSLQAMVLSIAEYEVVKNVIGALGKNISKMMIRAP